MSFIYFFLGIFVGLLLYKFSRSTAKSIPKLDLQLELEDAEDQVRDLKYQLENYKDKIKLMEVWRNDGSSDVAALEVAREIEDIFARGYTGGAVQRRSVLQVKITETVKEALIGTKR